MPEELPFHETHASALYRMGDQTRWLTDSEWRTRQGFMDRNDVVTVNLIRLVDE